MNAETCKTFESRIAQAQDTLETGNVYQLDWAQKYATDMQKTLDEIYRLEGAKDEPKESEGATQGIEESYEEYASTLGIPGFE
jgi:hypothetical protein